jgi:protocatechuate 3,4-dioxygenase beta subunit
LSEAEAATCLATPAQTEGPYFVEENLNRSDIRSDPATGAVKPGVLLTIKIIVSPSNNSGCGLLPGARVEIWHCDAGGLYSDVAQNNTRNQEFLRGYRVTDENGAVNFTTIFPGWYMGRAVHIHFKVRTYSGINKLDEFTSQFFFDESLTDTIHTQAPYNTRGRRDTLNSTDMIFRGTQNSDRLLARVTPTSQGYAAEIDFAVNLQTPVLSKAVLTSTGIVNAASYQAGIAPGAWITIFGQNLATATRTVATSDLVNNTLPTTLGDVGVKINNKDAFIQYVSPTQVNVQAPADESSGNIRSRSRTRAAHPMPLRQSSSRSFPPSSHREIT